MIILEGTDNIGKTTAAKRLCKLGGFEYRHMGPPSKETDWHPINFYTQGYDKMRVWDRYHLGERVYGRNLGLHSDYGTVFEWLKVDQFLRKQNCLIVIMYSSEKPFLRLKDEMQTPETVEKANHVYRNLASTGMHSHVAFDIAVNGYPTDETLKQWINRWSARQQIGSE